MERAVLASVKGYGFGMKWVIGLVVLVSAVVADVVGYFVLMVLLNGAGERAAGSALRFFAVGTLVAGLPAAVIAGAMTSTSARKGNTRFVQALWGLGAGWACIAVLAFLVMLMSFGIAS